MSGAAATLLHFAAQESRRFGLRVFRAEADVVDADALIETLERERVDVAILRVPETARDSIDALRMRGLAPIFADTIVRYETNLPIVSLALDDGVTLRHATATDAKDLDWLARKIFDGYETHYHANRLFTAAKIVEGYGEWAASHACDEREALGAWFVDLNGEVAGFSCYRVEREKGLAIGVLNGVLPAFRRRGVYGHMLRRMLAEFGSRGLTRFAIATQLQNVAVQRIWRAEGLVLTRTEISAHINAMRGAASASPESERA